MQNYKLKLIRSLLQMSQAEFAESLNLVKTTIYRIENQKVKYPDYLDSVLKDTYPIEYQTITEYMKKKGM